TRADDEDVAYAIACVTAFGTIAMLAYPMLAGPLGLDAHAYGLWAGASIHEVAQVVAAAFDKLAASGKVRHFGVSNHTPGQIELLKTAVTQPLLFNQVQLSIPHPNLFAQGVAANMDGLDQSVSRDNGLLDYSRL
ncbi:putative sulfate exporter family transporter, partial [Escherichia coli]|uniref:putative sulfate exporter family transporter n=1 Tax=Escherichia coli TaxID=562 RepID=UPI0028DE279F